MNRTDGRRRQITPPGQARRRWLIGGGLVAIVLLLATAWFGYHARSAQSDLGDATAEVEALQDDLRDGDAEAAQQTLFRLQDATSSAVSHMSAPGWGVVGWLPFVGDDVSAVRTAADSVDDIAQRALPPLVERTDALDPAAFRPNEGRIDVGRLADIAPSILAASEVLVENDERLARIDRSSLLRPVRGPVNELVEKVDSAAGTADTAATAARLLPSMLGQDGERRYALIVQNNAEARATGGVPGAIAILEVENGRIRLDEQLSTADFSPVENPVVDLTEDELNTYGETLASDIRDTNLTPHFPRTGQLVREFVDRQADTEVDGVISVDPVALSYVLRATGPVEVEGGQLTEQNAVELLLNTVYARYSDPAEQDAFFASAAERVFDAIVQGQGDPAQTLTELRRATAENRVMVWSANDDEQAILQPTGIGGALPVDTDRPDVGVYIADLTASKMQFYLDTTTRVTSDSCVDGRQRLTVTTTLRSKAPSDGALLPAYITGLGERGPLGSMRLRVYTIGPVGGQLERTEIDGEQIGGNFTRLGGRDGGRHLVLLGPGETIRLVSTMISGPDQRGDVLLSTTPGVESGPNDVTIGSSCD